MGAAYFDIRFNAKAPSETSSSPLARHSCQIVALYQSELA
jgi:hypothetical protein